MNFKDGLFYAYKTKRREEEVFTPFLLYCRLSDVCVDTLLEKEKVCLFYAVDKRVRIFQTLKDCPKKGKKKLLDEYAKVKDLLPFARFEALVLLALEVMGKGEKKQAKRKKARGQVRKKGKKGRLQIWWLRWKSKIKKWISPTGFCKYSTKSEPSILFFKNTFSKKSPAITIAFMT